MPFLCPPNSSLATSSLRSQNTEVSDRTDTTADKIMTLCVAWQDPQDSLPCLFAPGFLAVVPASVGVPNSLIQSFFLLSFSFLSLLSKKSRRERSQPQFSEKS